MRYACDCDLHKIYVLREDGQIVFNGVRSGELLDWSRFHLTAADTFLFEVASAKDYTGGQGGEGQAYNKRRWMIFNVYVATILHAFAGCPILVSPSSAWTRGLKLEVRHKLAGCKAKNKDLRECECMLYMHQHRPQDWGHLADFIREL